MKGKLFFSSVFGFLAIAVLLFLAAGTLEWWPGWWFLGVLIMCSGAHTLWMYLKRPDLLKERMQLSPKNQQGWDRIMLPIIFLIFLVMFLVAPLDVVRFHWFPPLPLWAHILGAVLIVVSFFFFYLAGRENPYMSAVVRIQDDRGHRVIDTGPYSIVRHPMYSGSLLMIIGMPLLLGSWLSLGLGLLAIVILAIRTLLEERTLLHELAGYDDYMRRVRFRFIPYIF